MVTYKQNTSYLKQPFVTKCLSENNVFVAPKDGGVSVNFSMRLLPLPNAKRIHLLGDKPFVFENGVTLYGIQHYVSQLYKFLKCDHIEQSTVSQIFHEHEELKYLYIVQDKNNPHGKKVGVYLLNGRRLDDFLLEKEAELNSIMGKDSQRLLCELDYEEQQARQFHYYLGETNSGKTFSALEKITKDDKAIYLAPLRLMAIEVYEKLNAKGIPCSLITGEEKIIKDGALAVSSTIEAMPSNERFDIAIIDEYQMQQDNQRGWAWNRAIISVNATDVYLLGTSNLRSVTMVSNLVLQASEKHPKIKLFKRRSKLSFVYSSLSMASFKNGDALITFSREKVLAYANRLAGLGFKVSVIYGDLPLEVRRTQAHNFMTGVTDVLVSTDAIGQGLNLPINRVIFAQDSKFDGSEYRKLTIEEIKQIGGRAGRDDVSGSVYMLNKNDVIANYYGNSYAPRLESEFKHINTEDKPRAEKMTVADIEKAIYTTKHYEYEIPVNADYLVELIEQQGNGFKSYWQYVSLFEKALKLSKYHNLVLRGNIETSLFATFERETWLKSLPVIKQIQLLCPPIQMFERDKYGHQVRTQIGQLYYDFLNQKINVADLIDISSDDKAFVERKLTFFSWLNQQLNLIPIEQLNALRNQFAMALMNNISSILIGRYLYAKKQQVFNQLDRVKRQINLIEFELFVKPMFVEKIGDEQWQNLSETCKDFLKSAELLRVDYIKAHQLNKGEAKNLFGDWNVAIQNARAGNWKKIIELSQDFVLFEQDLPIKPILRFFNAVNEHCPKAYNLALLGVNSESVQRETINQLTKKLGGLEQELKELEQKEIVERNLVNQSIQAYLK